MSVTFTAPTLETERLILRPPQASDFDAYATFFASDRAKFVGGPIPRERSWRTLAQESGHWVLRGYGRWIVTEKGDDTAIGIIGLWYPEGFPENELGWDLFDGATGKGYATEAGRAARHYAYETLGWTTLTSMIDPANTASAAVATRLGAAYDYDYTHPHFGPVQIWRHPGPEARA
ncbi:MAG: GNAT family N-acetyltransferase [Pseudomonadota bacterium]